MFPVALSLVFTVVFVVVGLRSLVRFAHATAEGMGGERAVELCHLLMSLAMVAMTWGWTGGPDSISGIAQIVAFGLFAVLFAVDLLRSSAGRGVAESGYHLLTAAAMVWMVAAMPLLMGMSADVGGAAAGGQHHGGSSGDVVVTTDAGAMTAAAPLWAVVVSWAFVLLLVFAAVYWVPRTIRTPDREAVLVGAGGPAAGPGPAVHECSRLDAGCHVLMALGMAAMLVAMS